MAKRFTDTDKWKREWFSELDPKAKLVWIYLLDQCDHCGIWPRNMKLLSEQTGIKLEEDTFQVWFHGKLVKFDSDKYFIPSFFEFQYGHSKDDFKAKKSAVSVLVKLGLMNQDGSLTNTTEHLANSSVLSSDSPSIGKSTIKSKILLKNEEEILKKQILEIYKRYPLKKGKDRGVKTLLASLTTEKIPLFSEAVERYRAECERENTDPKFVKHFSTFANHWEEYADPDYGTTDLKSHKAFDPMTAPLRGT